jgi:hypothetical protein
MKALFNALDLFACWGDITHRGGHRLHYLSNEFIEQHLCNSIMILHSLEGKLEDRAKCF